MNRVIHFEIHAKNLDTMQEFYRYVFGWAAQDTGPDMGNYRLLTTGTSSTKEEPGINGGITPRQGDLPSDTQAVNAFICTIDVNNIHTTLKDIQAAGGSLAFDIMDVPSVGKLAYCKDIEGNLFGILERTRL